MINVITKYINKILEIIKDNYIIIFIILIAFFIRWIGIYFDYPYRAEYIWDEGYQMKYLINVIEEKNLFAKSSGDPVLLAFLYFPILIFRIIYIAIREGIYNMNELKGHFRNFIKKFYFF